MDRPPRKPPTLADIARQAGVSPMTVSRALRDDGRVSTAMRAALRQLAEDLGYVPDSTASTLRRQRSGFVAVTLPSVNNANFAETLRGLNEGLAPQGVQILLGHTGYDPQAEEALVAQLLRRRPEAMVLTGGHHTPRTRQRLQAAGIPVVEVWDLPAEPLGNVVGFSNAEAAEMLVDHLAGLGLRRIAFLGGDAPHDTRGADRRAGFVTAMQRHGLAADLLADAGPAPVSMREGTVAMAALLARHPGVEAVVCVSDLAAFGALCECQRRGISVPGDIALCGFGNYEIAGTCLPALTTVDPHPHAIGLAAAAIIARALGASPPPPTTRHLITPRLLIRASTAG